MSSSVLTLAKRRGQTPTFIHISKRFTDKGFPVRGSASTYVNPAKDRSLSGKARKQARRAARKAVA